MLSSYSPLEQPHTQSTACSADNTPATHVAGTVNEHAFQNRNSNSILFQREHTLFHISFLSNIYIYIACSFLDESDSSHVFHILVVE